MGSQDENIRNIEIGERLAQVRKSAGLKQEDFADKYGVSATTQLGYEKGKTSPNAEYLCRLMDDGLDVFYLLTGKQQASGIAEAPAQYRAARPIDLELLEDVIIAGETALLNLRQEMSPAERAKLHTLLYEFFSGYLQEHPTDNMMISPSNVIPIIKAMRINKAK